MSSILMEIKNAVAVITLNRPDKLNSFNREMSLLLQQRLVECYSDKTIRCVCITGAGKAFSAGQDLAEVTDASSSMRNIVSEHFNPIVSSIRQLQKPVVAAVNGVAAGAGANIALCCDVVVAAQSAVFIQAFSKIGLIPDSGGTHILPRLIGWQKASALMMLGEKVSAEDAERMGMIYKFFSDDIFAEEAQKITIILSQMPTKGLAYTKQALNFSFTNTFHEQLQDEDILQQRAADTEDFREGVKAFLEKRQPIFKGV